MFENISRFSLLYAIKISPLLFVMNFEYSGQYTGKFQSTRLEGCNNVVNKRAKIKGILKI